MIKLKQLLTGFLLAVVAFAGLTGCKKFLDRKPYKLLSTTFHRRPNGSVIRTVWGHQELSIWPLLVAVTVLRTSLGGYEWFCSDDAEIVADPELQPGTRLDDNFQYTKDDWGAGYTGINTTSSLVCATTFSHRQKQKAWPIPPDHQYRGSAFLQGLFLFRPGSHFGAVPKIGFQSPILLRARLPTGYCIIYNLIKESQPDLCCTAFYPPFGKPNIKAVWPAGLPKRCWAKLLYNNTCTEKPCRCCVMWSIMVRSTSWPITGKCLKWKAKWYWIRRERSRRPNQPVTVISTGVV